MVSPIVADAARVGVVILLREEVEGVERLLALHREIADPLDELEATLEALHEQTGGRRAPALPRRRRGRPARARAPAQVGGRAACHPGGPPEGGAPQAARFEPAQLVRAVARRLRARAGATQVDLAFLAPATLPRARGDAAKLEAILLRLVQERLALATPPEALTLAARSVGRDADGCVLVTLSERFAGAAPAAAKEPPLVREVLAELRRRAPGGERGRRRPRDPAALPARGAPEAGAGRRGAAFVTLPSRPEVTEDGSRAAPPSACAWPTAAGSIRR